VAPDDVAVLTLQEPLVLGPAAAVISPVSPGASPSEGTAVNLTGFGQQNPESELNGKLYSLAMTVVYSRDCGGENDAVMLCVISPVGSPCNGDSGSGLTLGSPTMLAGVEDDYFLMSGKKCATGAENALTNVAAPEIQDFLDGSEEPPRAPRGGGAVIREAPINDGVMSCEPGHWSENRRSSTRSSTAPMGRSSSRAPQPHTRCPRQS
jgi:trypsin